MNIETPAWRSPGRMHKPPLSSALSAAFMPVHDIPPDIRQLLNRLDGRAARQQCAI